MFVEKMKENVEKIKRLVESTKPELQKYLKNKDIPLDERWELFENIGETLFEVEPYVVNFTDFGCRKYMEYLYYEKYETICS